MRRLMILTGVGLMAATVAAPWLRAQNSNGHTGQNGAPVADQFVSTPGQMVTGPGQMVTGPGQMVTGPGQMVIPPGVTIVSPGQVISPTPGVITPFHVQTQPGAGAVQVRRSGGRGLSRARRFHNRYQYRPEYGLAEGYALPYRVSGDYGAVTSESADPAGTGGRSLMGDSGSDRYRYGAAEGAIADAPSGNRPPYRPEREARPEQSKTEPNLIQSQEPVLVIVMKDGSRRKVRNYALTPQVLIDMDGAGSGRQVEIPLSEINVAATKKTAAQAGLSFAVPTN